MVKITHYSIYLLFFALLGPGCSNTGPDGGNNEIEITNSTSFDVLVDLWDQESSNGLDPAPAVSLGETSFIRINSDEAVTVLESGIKGGFSGDGEIRLFLFQIEGDSAYYQRSFSVSNSQTIELTYDTGEYRISTL